MHFLCNLIGWLTIVYLKSLGYEIASLYCNLTTFAAAASTTTTAVIVGQPLSKTERKVIRTMIIVIVCTFVCWFPANLCMLIYSFYPATFIAVDYIILTMLAYLNMVANPVIYGAHLNMVVNPVIYGAHFDAVSRLLQTICGRFSGKVATTSTSQSDQLPPNSRSTRYM